MSLSPTRRIVGLDVARAVAIIGMIGAHVGAVPDDVTWGDPATWGALVHGRASILFALLAGVSLALLSGGKDAHLRLDDDGLRRLRLRLVGRGIAILAIGTVLDLLGTPIAVILGLYGVVYVLAVLFVTWPPRRLLLVAGTLALVGPPLLQVVRRLGDDTAGPAARLILLGSYPLSVWLVFVLVGLAIGRVGLSTVRMLGILLGGGAALAVVGYGLGDLVGSGVIDPLSNTHVTDAWTAVAPHSGGTPEILGSGGLAMLVLGVCLLLGLAIPHVLTPLAALGSMPLSAYTLHVVIVLVAIGGPGGELVPDDGLWLVNVVALTVLAYAWRVLVGQGPLERWVAAVARHVEGDHPSGDASPA